MSCIVNIELRILPKFFSFPFSGESSGPPIQSPNSGGFALGNGWPPFAEGNPTRCQIYQSKGSGGLLGETELAPSLPGESYKMPPMPSSSSSSSSKFFFFITLL